MPESVCKRSNKLKSTLKAAAERLTAKPFLFTVGLSLVITLIVEIFSRHSVIGGFEFIYVHPVRFLVNVLIILSTMAVSHLFKKRKAVLLLITILWLALGIVNFILLQFRVTPLGMIDFFLLGACLGVINVYFDWWQLVLIGAVVFCVIAFVFFIFIKTIPKKVYYGKSCVFIAASVVLMLLCYNIASDPEAVQESFKNIAGAYSDFGFAYCFSTGAFDKGIDKPDEYSEGKVKKILSSLRDGGGTTPITPNIIMVQLESFFDVKYLEDTSFEEDPIPTFTSLKENYTSGFLTVPSVGAGTANTEFEVLSEMSLDFFGMGEYPYKTILQEESCESMCTILKELGYKCGAIHNNTGTFYDRNDVYAQLGFDTFDCLEYMQNVEYNPIGWAKDMCLVNEIVKTLDSDEGRNFVFTISVQGHGKYQRGAEEENIEGIDTEAFDDEDTEAAFEYYVSQISEMDDFITALVDTLSERGEPTVLVLYGDHLPNFDIGAEELENGDIFQTEYVMWDNIGLNEEDEDLSAYQLSSKLLGMLDIDNGILTKLHQQRYELDNGDYLPYLEILEYDMLYGSHFCYGGKDPYAPTELKMGSVPITISSAEWSDGILYVYGDGFTEWSEILIDGSRFDTELIDYNTLSVETDKPEAGQEISVQQKSSNLTVLSISEAYIISE